MAKLNISNKVLKFISQYPILESCADRGAGCGFLPARRSCLPADALAHEGLSAISKTDTTGGILQCVFEFC